MEAWYFAYGSNLSGSQLVARIGSAAGGAGQSPRLVRLADHRLVFQQPKLERPAYANIIPGGAGVLGVVYRFAQADFQSLDRYETGYERRTIIVQAADGEDLPAEAYLMRRQRRKVRSARRRLLAAHSRRCKATRPARRLSCEYRSDRRRPARLTGRHSRPACDGYPSGAGPTKNTVPVVPAPTQIVIRPPASRR